MRRAFAMLCVVVLAAISGVGDRANGTDADAGIGLRFRPDKVAGRTGRAFQMNSLSQAASIKLGQTSICLSAAWMEETLEENPPRPEQIFWSDESIDLGVLYDPGGEFTSGTVGIKMKLRGSTTAGRYKAKWKESISGNDVYDSGLRMYATLGILPVGRYRLRVKVKSESIKGKGDAEVYFTVVPSP